MNRPLFVMLSFVVSTVAALAVSGALHAQALNAPAAACVVHFDTPLSACDNVAYTVNRSSAASADTVAARGAN